MELHFIRCSGQNPLKSLTMLISHTPHPNHQQILLDPCSKQIQAHAHFKVSEFTVPFAWMAFLQIICMVHSLTSLKSFSWRPYLTTSHTVTPSPTITLCPRREESLWVNIPALACQDDNSELSSTPIFRGSSIGLSPSCPEWWALFFGELKVKHILYVCLFLYYLNLTLGYKFHGLNCFVYNFIFSI